MDVPAVHRPPSTEPQSVILFSEAGLAICDALGEIAAELSALAPLEYDISNVYGAIERVRALVRPQVPVGTPPDVPA